MPNKRKFVLMLADICCYLISGALFLGIIPGDSINSIPPDMRIFNFLLILVCIFLSKIIFRTYTNIWRYATAPEYFKLVVSDFFGGCVFAAVRYALPVYITFLRSVSVVSVACLISITIRCLYQLLRAHVNENTNDDRKDSKKINIAIIGAGVLGTSLASELRNTALFDKSQHYYKKYIPVCYIDSNKEKIGNYVNGIRVFSDDSFSKGDIKNKLNIEEFIIAIPNMPVESKKDLYEYYSKFGCPVKIYDYTLSDEKESINQVKADIEQKRVLRDFKIEDLLFRDTQHILDQEKRDYYKNKVILITGGGGSIGSELCRQIAKCKPKHLIIVDIYENNAYDIQQELLGIYKSFDPESEDGLYLTVEIASVRDYKKIDEIFRKYKPQIVFHAAAHKHVPLMENSPSEAIKNNIFGTYAVADISEKHHVEKFIMISTDKAVNPTNVMGASKRMCEMIIQSKKDSNTSFTAVRFGNVLGSNGSVIPLFKKQIENGGPITLTDKRIIRYFMTIPEASQLVMTAGAMAKSGELFVLDMGNPVRIIDLAENMIRLSGLTPYKDINIAEIGLRPGEKLYEELLIKSESLTQTENKMIFVERDEGLSRKEVDEKLAYLQDALDESNLKCDNLIIKNALKEVVPTFRDPSEVNTEADNSNEMKICCGAVASSKPVE